MATKNQQQGTLLTPQMRSIFETYPFPSIVVNTDKHFTIAKAIRAFINNTEIKEQVKDPVGKSLFIYYPGNESSLREALELVLSTKEALKTSITVDEFVSGDTDKETGFRRLVLTPILNNLGKGDYIIYSFLPRDNHDGLPNQQNQQELEEQQLLLDKAYRLARIGIWEFDMQTYELQWSEITKEVHGFGPDYEPDLESTINLFKEGLNRQKFTQAAREAIEEEKPL